MSELTFQISHDHRTITMPKVSPSALVQTLLESVCRQLKLDPHSSRLIQEKGEKKIDHAATIKMANLKTNTKLAIVKIPSSYSSSVSLTLQWKDSTFTSTLPVTSTLFDVLTHFEREHQHNWTDWHGIPEPEVGAGFEIHINVAGYMQPVLELVGRKFDKNADLKETTLANLGLAADSAQPKKVRAKLTHSYTAPVRTEAEKAEIMANFQRRFAEATGATQQSAPAPSSASTPHNTSVAPPSHPATLFEDEDEDVLSSSDDESDVAPARFTLPPNRGRKIFHALPGLIPPAELPEEFYEVTEEDSRVYAQSLRREAAKYAREMQSQHGGATVELMNEDDEKQPTPPASSSSSKLLDSHRLPPAPSAQARRNARVRRKCHAALIRIRVSPHLYVEGLFLLSEGPKAIYQFLDEILQPSMRTDFDYYLYLTPPRQVLTRHSHLTLEQLQLFPQALIHLGSAQKREQQQGTGSFQIKPDTPEEVAAKEQQSKEIIREEFWDSIQIHKPADMASESKEENITNSNASGNTATNNSNTTQPTSNEIPPRSQLDNSV